MPAPGELRHCIPLPQEEPLTSDRLSQLGGKAASLMQLALRDFPVLPGVVLLSSALERSRHGPAASASPLVLGSDDPHEVDFPTALDVAVMRELRQALADLSLRSRGLLEPVPTADGHSPGGPRWAVRSSALAEDGSQASFAGQFRSCLDVPSVDLETAILAVWRSGFADALASYRHSCGLDAPEGEQMALQAPAVLIQPMLSPRCAGVSFSADPVSGRRGVSLVQAVAGVAADLVAGTVEGEHWLLDRDGRLLLQRPAPAAADSAQRTMDARPLLQEPDARRIAALTRRLGHHFGVPQDVEWALMDDGRLWLLQSRAITTLRGLNDPDGRLALWDNSNIVESYSGVTTPLTFSFAHRAYSEVYAQFCRFMGVEEERIRRNRAVFGSMIGFLEGRIYYNLLSWYRVLALLPGYRLNARFLEQMLGLKHRLPPAQMEQIHRQQRQDADADPSPRWLEGLRLGRSLFGLVANALSLGRRSRAFRRRLDRLLLSPDQLAALSDARPDELVSLYRRIEAELLCHWDAPLINDFYAMIVYGTLRNLSRRWCCEQNAAGLHDWIAGDASVISAEPPRRIRAMAELLLQRPELVDTLQHGHPSQLARAVAAVPALQLELDRYLDAFGDRCLEELKLETLTLREDPLPLLRSIGAMAQRLRERAGDTARGTSSMLPDSGAMAQGSGRRPASQSAAKRGGPALPGQPLRLWLLQWLLGRTRALVSNRENLRFERTRVFGLARLLLLELGRRLAELDLLERADDVLFLEVEEALGMVEGNGSTTDLRGLVAVRRAAWRRQTLQAPLPRRLETRGLPSLATAALLAEPPQTEAPGESEATTNGGVRDWQGTGCAPGRVRGRVSLVTDPRQWLEAPRPRQQAAPILVAGSTDPGWVLLFPHACGLLVERGSVLSHVAIVARELGLPMVTDLGGITASLQEGDWVEMDGRSGTVSRVQGTIGMVERTPSP